MHLKVGRVGGRVVRASRELLGERPVEARHLLDDVPCSPSGETNLWLRVSRASHTGKMFCTLSSKYTSCVDVIDDDAAAEEDGHARAPERSMSSHAATMYESGVRKRCSQVL